jgi:hypothetical protein
MLPVRQTLEQIPLRAEDFLLKTLNAAHDLVHVRFLSHESLRATAARCARACDEVFN